MSRGSRELCTRFIKHAFLGEIFEYGGVRYPLEPTLVEPKHLTKLVPRPTNSFERALNVLPSSLRSSASSELYRPGSSWVNGRVLRKVECGGVTYLLPVLSPPRVGIDSSGFRSSHKEKIYGIVFFSDPEVGYTYITRHLSLPLRGPKKEVRWYYLSQNQRNKAIKNLELLMHIACRAVLVIKTDLFVDPPAPAASVIRNVIRGLFSGYESRLDMFRQRQQLKRAFFGLINRTPIHCDPDFEKIQRSKAVSIIVEEFATLENGTRLEYEPNFVELDSEQSHPIQVADVIVGALRTTIEKEKHMPPYFKKLFFDGRKKPGDRNCSGFYWFPGY